MKAMTDKQYAAAVSAAVLSPLLRAMPGAAVRAAGAGAWLCAVPAFFAVLALFLLLASLRRAALPGEGMSGLILRIAGNVPGRLILALCGAWLLFCAGIVLRGGAERLTDTVYDSSTSLPFILVMFALCLAAALGSMRAMARTATVLRAVLLSALALAAALAVSNIDPRNLALPTAGDALPGLLRGAAAVASLGGAVFLLSFLWGYSGPCAHPARRACLSAAALCLGAGLLCFGTVGSFGAALTARLRYPFFTMVRDVSFFNVAPRIEAVVIVQWVFADFVMCVLLMRSAHEALRTALFLPSPEGLPISSLARGRWLMLAEGAATLACAVIPGRDAGQTAFLQDAVIPAVTAALAYGGVPLLWLTGRLREII